MLSSIPVPHGEPKGDDPKESTASKLAIGMSIDSGLARASPPLSIPCSLTVGLSTSPAQMEARPEFGERESGEPGGIILVGGAGIAQKYECVRSMRTTKASEGSA